MQNILFSYLLFFLLYFLLFFLLFFPPCLLSSLSSFLTILSLLRSSFLERCRKSLIFNIRFITITVQGMVIVRDAESIIKRVENAKVTSFLPFFLFCSQYLESANYLKFLLPFKTIFFFFYFCYFNYIFNFSLSFLFLF